MITAQGPLNSTGIAKAFALNVKALGVFDHVQVLSQEDAIGDVLFVQSTSHELKRISETPSFGRYESRVAYYVWETEEIPKSTIEVLQTYDHVWTASRFCAEALLRSGGISSKVVPHCVSVYSLNPLPEREFKFLTIFDSHSRILRKNPFDVVTAFEAAFGNRKDVSLTIKARNLTQEFARVLKRCGPTANIKLINEDLTEEQMENLYAEHDALVSLHQGEGFGLTILEAMARGMKVIYTNWSAPTEFAVGYPVAFRLAPSADDFYKGQLVAHPILDSAVDAFRRAVTDSDEIRVKAFRRSLDYSFSNLIKRVSDVYFDL